jgi:spermidine synthase/Tfp pilus assembly protein PilF
MVEIGDADVNLFPTTTVTYNRLAAKKPLPYTSYLMQLKSATDKTKKDLLLPVLATGTTVFVSSACVMMLEIVAGRLAARQYGASLYTWTAVIGVTLAGLTIGNYIGGRLADRFWTRQTIGWLFGACSVTCVAAIAINNLAGEWTLLWRLGLAARVLAHITMVFFIPSALIGAIIPVAIKTALEPNYHSGRIVGRMYALGAAGSILGTFLAGFWLIAAIGTVKTLWLVAAAMLLGAFVYLPKSLATCAYAAPVAFLIAVGMTPAVWAERLGSALMLRQMRTPDLLYEAESQYCYIAVRQVTKQPDERQFVQDNMKNHSRMIMGNIRELRLFYARVYGAVTHRAARDKEKLCTLSIGGGGYVFPRYILDVWPGSRVDVAEIDPAVTEAATRAFGLPADTIINTINLDGRNYVDELLERKRLGKEIPQYDFVYMDAFNDMSVPFQLVTRQFNEKIFAILAADGVYMVNLIDMFYGGKFLASIVRTVSQTFGHVYVVTRPTHPDLPVNFIVIAGKKPVNLENLNAEEQLANTSLRVLDDIDLAALEAKGGQTILDDDYGPVENFMAPLVRQASAAETAEKYIRQAEELNTAGRWEKAVSKYRLAIRTCPAYSLGVNYLMGLILADHGKLTDAAAAFRSSLAQSEVEESKVIMPTLHYNLGLVLKKLGDADGASQHFASAIELLRAEAAGNGGSAETFSRLGQVEAASGNMQEATLYFEQALNRDPDNITHHLAVVEALAAQGQYEEAMQRLDKGIQYMLSKGRKEEADQLEKLGRRIEKERKLMIDN